MQKSRSSLKKLFGATKYEDPILETEYQLWIRKTCSIFSKSIVMPILMLFVVVILPVSLEFRWIRIALSLGLLCFFVLTLSILRKFAKKFAILCIFVIVFSLVILVYWNLEILVIAQDFASTSLFLNGYSVALLSQIIQTGIPSIRNQIYLNLGLFLIKIFGLCTRRSLSLDLDQLALSVAIDFLNIFIQLHRENDKRSHFKKVSDEIQILKQYEQLVTKSLPHSLLILSTDLNEVLFSNQNFNNNFLPTTNGTSNLMTLQILSLFKIHQELDLTTSLHAPATSLLSSLQELTDGEILKSHLVHLNVLLDQKIYEVRVFQAPWGKKNSLALTFNDLSDQEKTIALKVADDNKDKVIASISHELKTPLNAILGILQIMEKGTDEEDEPELFKYIQLCRNNSALLLSMIQSFLDLQSARKSQLKFNIAQVNIREMMHTILNMFEYLASNKGIELSLELESQIPESINTDGERLFQVFVHLVSNAIKFTPEGRVSLGACSDPVKENAVLFWVEDTGIGMAEEEKKNLFKLFGKLETSETVSTQGCGIGLNISNIIVNHLSGNNSGISVQSELGKGSTFSFSLAGGGVSSPDLGNSKKNTPTITIKSSNMFRTSLFNENVNIEKKFKEYNSGLASPGHRVPRKSITMMTESKASSFFGESMNQLLLSKEPSFKKPKKYDRHRRFQSAKFGFGDDNSQQSSFPALDEDLKKLDPKWVLVVDDNMFNILVARHFLEAHHYTVKSASNGQEAIKVVKDHINAALTPFEFIFMDCQMPILDGFEATRKLRKMMKNQELPEMLIFALTANDSEADKKKCIASGMEDVLSKPLKEEDLVKFLTQKNFL